MVRSTVRSLAFAAAVLAGSIAIPTAVHAQNLPASYRPEFGTMWTFDSPPLEYWKARYNFTPDQGWLDHLRQASIRLPGCSASFVSADGLVMTNHHCARSCISQVSPADTNYQTTGFIAPAREQEKKCPNLYVDQLQSIEDVTRRVQAKVTAANAAQRVEQRDAEIDAIQRECQQGTGLTCQVVGFYQGGMYSLYRFRRFNDLRLVFAPEESVSFFGGDPDNFTFPRYDLDVTLLRVYDNNQPLKPANFLKWSANGAKEGDLVFVTGNPGSTGRLLTMSQMEYLRDVTYPAQIAALARQIAILERLSQQSPEARRRYENTLFGAQNSLKAITGYLSGLTNDTIMARKRAFEKDFRARITADPKLRTQFGNAWAQIDSAQRQLTRIAPQARYYPLAGSTLLNLAAFTVRLPVQMARADSLRLPQYRGAAGENLRNQLLGNIPVDPVMEQAVLSAWLAAARQDLDPKDPVLVALLAGRTPEQAAADLIKATQIGDASFRRTLVEGGATAVAASKDPLVELVRKLDPVTLPVSQRVARLNASISANAERVGQAIFAAYGRSLPPDATFSLRISDGVVKGYPMNGTIAPYKTSFYGLFARNAEFDDKEPFKLPQRWLNARAALDLSTPLNFVSTNDIIGGNSGSPVVNRNGEVVGLIFDGNIQQLPNRFIFTDEVARSVSVHSRAITEATRKVFGAPKLADELEGR
ncbi:MAG TPA: S46 family peptidase [Longimicrobiales bacterium]|nr:S46 family peptidase [Longimicrobiales bacterium]